MALSIVRGLQEQYQQSLFNEGILNENFSRIQELKASELGSESFIQTVDGYFTCVESLLSEIENIDHCDVEFSKLALLVAQIEERSSRIGAEHVRVACLSLRRACNQANKKNLLRALGWTKREFAHTKNKLEALIQMERRIMRLEAKGKTRNSTKFP